MRIGGWKTRAVFDRYNVVAEDDVREAAKRLQAAAERHGRDLDEIGSGGAEHAKAPRSEVLAGPSVSSVAAARVWQIPAPEPLTLFLPRLRARPTAPVAAPNPK